ncbi:MAG: glycoside hydrolase family 2 protein, partial [bacterium]
MHKILFLILLPITLVLLYGEFTLASTIMPSDEINKPRETHFLIGKWDLSLDNKFSRIYKVNVPGCIGIEVPELRDYRGEFYYRKKFDIKEISTNSVYYLYFGSINYYSEIWLNGQLIGSHEGGYTPFSFEITNKLKNNNELIVKVLLPSDNDPNYPFSEIPHGKQTWYGTAGGILGDVYIIKLSKDYIKNIYITPDIDNSQIKVKGEATVVNKDRSILFRIYDPNGQEIGEYKYPLTEKFNKEISILNPTLWDIDNPKLYKLEVSILYKDKLIDKFTKYFGMRKIEVKDREILLNDRPIFIMGTLDQDFYPDTHYIPPSEEFVKNELILAKQMGLNCLRYHIKVPHPWYLKWADRLGVLVWYDIPNWDRSTPKAKARGEKLLEEMVAYDYNHPSVIIRTIINESWGVDLPGNYDDRKWLENMYDKLKALDPTRLVVDNSPCCNNFHIKTDINDFHNYFAFPDRFSAMKSWVSEYANGPSWTFGAGGNRKGNEPLLVSEFGNWGLPDFSKLKAYYKGNPWWFAQGNIDNGTSPLGVEERFKDYGLNKIFSPSSFAQSFQELQHQALRFQIEEIRKHPEIKGYIITEFTDLY